MNTKIQLKRLIIVPVQWNGNQRIDWSDHRNSLNISHQLAHHFAEYPSYELEKLKSNLWICRWNGNSIEQIDDSAIEIKVNWKEKRITLHMHRPNQINIKKLDGWMHGCMIISKLQSTYGGRYWTIMWQANRREWRECQQLLNSPVRKERRNKKINFIYSLVKNGSAGIV